MSRKKRLDELMEAVTFAEAGEVDTARGIASRVFRDEGARRGERILALSRASGFSRRMIEQAVGLAERLGFGLVALSLPGFARLLARPRSRTEQGAWLPVETFRATAAERGVPFEHAAARGDPERAVAEIRRRFRRIAFLLVEPAHSHETRLARVNLPVFYLDEG
jgi:hypothetical protein